ncbi:ABC transporter ATP-binding protein [Olsenella sp. HMSC062G07]|uniref:ABC transporter ATP-binding protein n=1 Tax=Olsenella sp. HMSC062G07 TaxID=1739330 RepID=UPI001FEF8368|nr:ABC transporter ATP-binding protein [Olsenella sp. HMSC062G07]
METQHDERGGQDMGELLRMEGVDKRFGSFYANRGVNLSIREGEVHTLLGENGAGKSTLMNCLIGLYTPEAGKIYMHGEEVRINTPRDAVDRGIGMVHQHFMLVDAMTGLENIILGDKRHASPLLQRGDDRKTVEELMERYGLEVDLDARISDMSIGMQQRVEILKVLFRGADLLILDEPTAVLTDLEVQGLFDIMRSLTDEGKSIVFISHKMREVMFISDRVTVLRRGECVDTLDIANTTEQELADLMIGQKFTESSYRKVEAPGEVRLRLKNVCYRPQMKHGGLRDVSLTLHKGEILGVAGIDGNGQTPLAEVVTGLVSPESGEVIGPDGSSIALFSPQAFIEAGIGNIPEDRNKMGLVGDMTVAENLVLKQTGSERFSAGRGAWLKMDAIQRFADELREENDIRCTSVNQTARSLSGGNQQKVILARELDSHPQLLVAVYPTRGLDIGATGFVHDQIVAQRDAGCSVLLISADFDEVLKLSDRIVVLFEGQIMGTYPGANPPIKEISLAMAGK